MVRNARKNVCSKFFHVMIQGINKEYIFQNENEIKTYLKYLKEKTAKRNLQIIAYCIMNNHAHFLIHTDDILEITKLMSQVNTKYAIFYNRTHDRRGYVFKNRYKSEQIVSYSHLISCINYIHNNPVKAGMCAEKGAYKYSSYNEYKKDCHVLDMTAIQKIFRKYNIFVSDIFNGKYESDNFIEEDVGVEDKEKLKKQIIKDFCNKNNITKISEIASNKKYLKDLATILYIKHSFTQKEIGEILGVGRLKIHRILNYRDVPKSSSFGLIPKQNSCQK